MKKLLLLLVLGLLNFNLKAQDFKVYEKPGALAYDPIIESVTEGAGQVITTIGQGAYQGLHLSVTGYPNLAVQAGISRFSGEFLRMKLCLGGMGGLVVYGTVGKDWIWNLPNKEKIAWNVGLGYYFAWESTYGECANNAINATLSFGETPTVRNYGLMVDIQYDHWFGERGIFGIFGSAGVGIGDTKDKNGRFIWDISAGIAVKLWQK